MLFGSFDIFNTYLFNSKWTDREKRAGVSAVSRIHEE